MAWGLPQTEEESGLKLRIGLLRFEETPQSEDEE